MEKISSEFVLPKRSVSFEKINNRTRVARGKLSPYVKLSFLVLACLQNMTMGGVIFGWTSISSNLLISTIRGPGLSAQEVHNIYVLAVFFSSLGPMLLGIFLDAFGPRCCSVVSIFLVTSGFIIFSFSSNTESMNYFTLSMCLIAFGGPGAQSAIIHLSNLFPHWKATATALITGSFQLSFIIFYLFDQLWLYQGWNYRTLFNTYAYICIINLLISLTLWPDKPYSFDEQLELMKEDKLISEREVPVGFVRLPSVMVHQTSRFNKDLKSGILNGQEISNSRGNAKLYGTDAVSASVELGSVSSAATDSLGYTLLDNIDSGSIYDDEAPKHEFNYSRPVIVDLKNETFTGQVLSGPFIRLVFFFVVTSFWVNFYVGTAVMQLGDGQVVPASELDTYGQYFTLIMTSGILVIPILGRMMDNYGFPITSFFTTFFGVGWSLLLASEIPSYVLVSFAFYSLFRTFLYTFLFAYLADVLGFKFYGMLAGILFVVSGVFGLLQYPFTSWAQGTCYQAESQGMDDYGQAIVDDAAITTANCNPGRWTLLNYIMALSITALFSFTYMDYVERRDRQALTD